MAWWPDFRAAAPDVPCSLEGSGLRFPSIAGARMLCAAGLLGFPVLARQVTAQNDWVQDSDYALLHAKASGQDLECRLTRIAPFLGIDLLYHAGFEVHVPRRQFRADGVLRITTEITPARPRGAPRYFVQDLSVQPAGGEADGGALFSLGEGEYRVNWLMRGRGGRFRTAHWSFRVGSSRYGAKVETAMHPGHIEVAGIDPFSQPPEVKGGHLGRLKVAVFVNVAPPDPSAAALSTRDRFALGSMLKVIERDARATAGDRGRGAAGGEERRSRVSGPTPRPGDRCVRSAGCADLCRPAGGGAPARFAGLSERAGQPSVSDFLPGLQCEPHRGPVERRHRGRGPVFPGPGVCDQQAVGSVGGVEEHSGPHGWRGQSEGRRTAGCGGGAARCHSPEPLASPSITRRGNHLGARPAVSFLGRQPAMPQVSMRFEREAPECGSEGHPKQARSPPRSSRELTDRAYQPWPATPPPGIGRETQGELSLPPLR